MKTLKEELINIYCNEFNKHNYYPKLSKELDEKLKHITKETMVQLLIDIISEEGNEIKHFFNKEEIENSVESTFFEINKINPYNIGLNAINYNYDENGKKVIDLCYDLPENYYLNN